MELKLSRPGWPAAEDARSSTQSTATPAAAALEATPTHQNAPPARVLFHTVLLKAKYYRGVRTRVRKGAEKHTMTTTASKHPYSGDFDAVGFSLRAVGAGTDYKVMPRRQAAR